MSADNPTRGQVWQTVTLQNSHDLILAQHGHLPPDRVRTVVADAVVDMGEMMVALPPSIVDQLGLRTVGRTAKRTLVEPLELEVQGRRGPYRAVVDPDRDTPLIGLMVLQTLDFLIDPLNRRLVPRDPDGITAEI